jgi:hypothetical protein
MSGIVTAKQASNLIKVSGQLLAPTALSPGKESLWVAFRIGLDDVKKEFSPLPGNDL